MKLLKDEPRRSLNKREEIVGKCRHRQKHLLGMIQGQRGGDSSVLDGAEQGLEHEEIRVQGADDLNGEYGTTRSGRWNISPG